MYSTDLINTHFWMSTIGTVLYIASMWVNGILQGLMWRAYNQDGTLTYSFRRVGSGQLPGLRGTGHRWRYLLSRHADNGLQRVHDQPERRSVATGPGCSQRGIRSGT